MKQTLSQSRSSASEGTAPPSAARKTSVVIVGAGPTGLALACSLAQKGVDLIVVDKAKQGANTSRAAVVHARTMEVLEEVGVTKTLLAEGKIVPNFSVRDRDHVLNAVSFADLPTDYPFTLMIPQYRTEEILRERLEHFGGRVEWSSAATSITQGDDGCSVTVETDDGHRTILHCDYVVGADGMHSRVREAAGIPFEGGSYEQSFVLADVTMDWPLPEDEVELFFSPAGLMVVAALPGNHFRIVATYDDPPENPDQKEIQALLDERGPAASPATVHSIIWSSRFHVHHRLAQNFRKGRLLLAGDAAHVHSPAGGQGMNTGIQDAIALSAALSEALAPHADQAQKDRALNRYDASRRRVAAKVVALTDRMTHAALLRSPRARKVRNTLISIVGSIPLLRRRIAYELAELGNRA